MLDLSNPGGYSASLLSESGFALPDQRRLSRPESGRSLGASVIAAEPPIRDAVSALCQAAAITKPLEAQLFGCTRYGPGATIESPSLRLAWFMVATWLLYARQHPYVKTATFAEALQWFTGDPDIARRTLGCYARRQLVAAELALSKLSVSNDLWDLLPYVLEPHGHITRSELETCEIAKKIRSTKKATGVYYTPSDVADFMVASVAGARSTNGNWFDPACGTGVFLRAILRSRPRARASALTFIECHVFAIDKSALATDLASFVLLADCGAETPQGASLFATWQRIKANVVCMDALRILPNDCTPSLLEQQHSTTVREIFPSVQSGVFDHLVMNPPYASVSIDSHLANTWHSYRDLAAGSSGDTHLAFTEMLWRLSSATSTSIAVLPLAVGTNTTKSYRSLRDALLGSSGLKEFLFFDREPQALFGEDIKTRSAIVFRQTGPTIESEIRTTRMLKWTAQQRPAIFSRDRAVPVHSHSCATFIPKLGTPSEVIIYEKLRSAPLLHLASRNTPDFSRQLLADTDPRSKNRSTVLVSATAYNFVNCFFAQGLPSRQVNPYSNSPLNTLTFSTDELGTAAFAILSSRLCFWLWHAEGDGFHLTNEFLRRLPAWAALGNPETRKHLTCLGAALWTDAREGVLASLNGGKQTYSFHAGHAHPITLQIDRLLSKTLDLIPDAPECLEEFVRETVSVDGKSRGRGLSSQILKSV